LAHIKILNSMVWKICNEVVIVQMQKEEEEVLTTLCEDGNDSASMYVPFCGSTEYIEYGQRQ